MSCHEIYMEKALRLAKEAAAAGEVPVGCVIVRDGEIVGAGRNRREEKQSALSHAEIEAITMANAAIGSWRLEDCTLYVTLEPCPMCAGAILNARIPRLLRRRRPGAGGLRRRDEPLHGGLPPCPRRSRRHTKRGVCRGAGGLLPRPAEVAAAGMFEKNIEQKREKKAVKKS